MYSYVKYTFKQCLNAYFKDIEIVNEQNIPQNCPLIICCNHFNQFVDGTVLMNSVNRKIKFLGAAKSVRRPLLGQVMSSAGVIAVERQQDTQIKPQGTINSILYDSNMIVGNIDTRFTQLIKGDIIKTVDKKQFVVDSVINDQQLLFSNQEQSQNQQNKVDINQQFVVHPKIDQSQMYEEVWTALKDNEAIVIFPEGGSHDRSDLLPLKAGVCIMAMGAQLKYGIKVQILCAGINYYRQDAFQSKVFVQFNNPFQLENQLIQMYSNNSSKRQAISILLGRIETKLRQVVVTAPSIDNFKSILLISRIYVQHIKQNSNKNYLIQLNLLFCYLINYHKQAADIEQLFKQTQKYQDRLQHYNLVDRDLLNFQENGCFFVYYFVIFMVSLSIYLPIHILVGPIQILLNYLGEQERQKALKNSTVKIKARDVILSIKFLYSIVVFPLFAMIYSFMIFVILDLILECGSGLTLLVILGFILGWYFIINMFFMSYSKLKSSKRILKSKLYLLFFKQQMLDLVQSRRQLETDIVEIIEKYKEEILGQQDMIMDVDILENLNRSIMLEDAFRILREIPDLQY